MNIVKGIEIKQTGPFKAARFDFHPGLSVVYGLNKTNARNSRNANGAGKSFLFNTLYEMLFDNPVVGEKQDRIKKGTRTAYLNLGGKDVTLVRQGSKIILKRDGKKKTFRTIAAGRQWIKDNFQLTEEEASTYLYLDSQVPHPLVMGKSTVRRNFFTSFFRLDQIDAERKLFVAELAKLNKLKASRKELESEYEASKADLLPTPDLKVMADLCERREAKLQKLSDEQAKIQDTMRLLNFYATMKDHVEALTPSLKSWQPDDFKELARIHKLRVRKASEALDAAYEYRSHKQALEEYEATFKALPKAAKQLLAFGFDKAKEKVKVAYKEWNKATADLEELTADLQAAQRELKTYADLEAVDNPNIDEGEVRANLKAIKHQLEHAKKFKTGTCGECGQEVTVKDTKKLAKLADKLNAQLEQQEAYDDYLNAKRDKTKCKAEVKDLTSKVEACKSRIESTEARANLYDCIMSLPQKPDAFTGEKISVKAAKGAVDGLTVLSDLLTRCEPHVDTLNEYFGLSKADIKEAKAATDLGTQIQELTQKVARARGTIEAQRELRKRVKRIQERLEELDAGLVNEEALRLLVEAHSDKEMKKLAIQSISNRLMAKVNEYAKAVFPEDFYFEFKWDTSDLAILVHRNNSSKKTDPTDVRKLSGAERKLFTLVLVLALLTFVPDAKRCSVLILDEPSANMSEETTQAFQELLPIINTVVPSVVVITPKTSERYENAHNYTVVKEKGISRIEKGHPSEIRL